MKGDNIRIKIRENSKLVMKIEGKGGKGEREREVKKNEKKGGRSKRG